MPVVVQPSGVGKSKLAFAAAETFNVLVIRMREADLMASWKELIAWAMTPGKGDHASPQSLQGLVHALFACHACWSRLVLRRVSLADEGGRRRALLQSQRNGIADAGVGCLFSYVLKQWSGAPGGDGASVVAATALEGSVRALREVLRPMEGEPKLLVFVDEVQGLQGELRGRFMSTRGGIDLFEAGRRSMRVIAAARLAAVVAVGTWDSLANTFPDETVSKTRINVRMHHVCAPLSFADYRGVLLKHFNIDERSLRSLSPYMVALSGRPKYFFDNALRNTITAIENAAFEVTRTTLEALIRQNLDDAIRSCQSFFRGEIQSLRTVHPRAFWDAASAVTLRGGLCDQVDSVRTLLNRGVAFAITDVGGAKTTNLALEPLLVTAIEAELASVRSAHRGTGGEDRVAVGVDTRLKADLDSIIVDGETGRKAAEDLVARIVVENVRAYGGTCTLEKALDGLCIGEHFPESCRNLRVRVRFATDVVPVQSWTAASSPTAEVATTSSSSSSPEATREESESASVRLLRWFLHPEAAVAVTELFGARLGLNPAEAYIRRLEDTARTDGAFWLFQGVEGGAPSSTASSSAVASAAVPVGIAGVQVATGDKSLSAFAQGASVADAYLTSTGSSSTGRDPFLAEWARVPGDARHVQVRIFVSLLKFGDDAVEQVTAFNSMHADQPVVLCHFPRVLPEVLRNSCGDLSTSWDAAIRSIFSANRKAGAEKIGSAPDADLRTRESVGPRRTLRGGTA